jgi:hypothetical protein
MSHPADEEPSNVARSTMLEHGDEAPPTPAAAPPTGSASSIWPALGTGA